MGPIIFLIYVNDTSNSCELNILGFADDSTASLSESDVTLLYQKVNLELAKLNDWFCANKLSLNATKTKCILFRPIVIYLDLCNMHIKPNGQPIHRIGNNIWGNGHSINKAYKLRKRSNYPQQTNTFTYRAAFQAIPDTHNI